MRYEYKNFAFSDEASTLAAEASLCADDQGQFWPYHNMIFANQSTLFDAKTNISRALKQIAETLGLDTKASNKCFNRREHRQDVQQLKDEGRSKGVSSTPTVFVNGVKVEYPLTFERIQQVIEKELTKASQ